MTTGWEGIRPLSHAASGHLARELAAIVPLNPAEAVGQVVLPVTHVSRLRRCIVILACALPFASFKGALVDRAGLLWAGRAVGALAMICPEVG